MNTERTELDWIHIRAPSDISRIKKLVERHKVNGFEKKRDKNDFTCYLLGYQEDNGQVAWKAGVWLQLWEIEDKVEGEIRRQINRPRGHQPAVIDGPSLDRSAHKEK